MSTLELDALHNISFDGSLHPVKVKGTKVLPHDDLSGMENIKAEASRISKLLKEPLNPNRSEQAKRDVEIEAQITRLGLAIGEEAERRACYNERVINYYKKKGEQRFHLFKSSVSRALADEYKKIIAEIREVGGSISTHPYSTQEMVDLFGYTVEQHYPSDWIQASNDAGTFALVKGEAGSTPHYAHRKHWERNLEVKNSLIRDTMYVPADRLEYMFNGLRANDHSINIESVPFEIGDQLFHGFTFNSRELFDPEVHEMDENGKPVGDEWIFDTFRYGNDDPDYEGTYFRFDYQAGETIPTLTLPDDEYFTPSTAYHEFIHRLEETLHNGVLKRQQIAFLARRTSTRSGGTRPVSHIGEDKYEKVVNDPAAFQIEVPKGREGDFVIPYISREYLAAGNREVLAVGAEMLFAEALGGFLGLDAQYEKIDEDHRGFVLGIFATA